MPFAKLHDKNHPRDRNGMNEGIIRVLLLTAGVVESVDTKKYLVHGHWTLLIW